MKSLREVALIIGVIAAAIGLRSISREIDPTGLLIPLLGAMFAVFYYLRVEIRRLESRLCGADDSTYDKEIDDQVSKACEPLIAHVAVLEAQKRELPKTDLFEISSNRNWEAQLVAKAEGLRHLVEEAYGSTPDTLLVSQQAHRVPMTYELAHALAEYAMLQKNLAIKSNEWSINRIEVLGSSKKRLFSLGEIAAADQATQETAIEVDDLRKSLPRVEQNVWKAFREACDRSAPPSQR